MYKILQFYKDNSTKQLLTISNAQTNLASTNTMKNKNLKFKNVYINFMLNTP